MINHIFFKEWSILPTIVFFLVIILIVFFGQIIDIYDKLFIGGMLISYISSLLRYLYGIYRDI
jgi:hypothetical protein